MKVSVNDVVIKAEALALRDVPRANSPWDGTTSVPNDQIDISSRGDAGGVDHADCV